MSEIHVYKIYTNGAREHLAGPFSHPRLADTYAQQVTTSLGRERRAAAEHAGRVDRWADVRAIEVTGAEGITRSINAAAFPTATAPTATPSSPPSSPATTVSSSTAAGPHWRHVATLR